MRILKEVAWWAFVLSGLSWIAARLNRRKSVVLLYHGLYDGTLNPALNFDRLHVRVDRFERQMRYIAAHYRVVPLDQLLDGEAAAAGGRPLAAISFDDGYCSIYRYGYPVLKRLGLPATAFVVTDFLQARRALWWDRLSAMVASTHRQGVLVPMGGTPRWYRLATVGDKVASLQALRHALLRLPPQHREALLSQLALELGVKKRTLGIFRPLQPKQLREMAESGIAVGGHGASHDSFLHLNREELAAELTESKRVLESITGRPVRWLAYPHGEFSHEAVDAAKEAGYRAALTAIDEGLNNGTRDPFAVRRIGVADDMSLVRFIVAVSGLRDALKGWLRWRRLRARAFVALAPGWLGTRLAECIRNLRGPSYSKERK